jgi:hypothetical protein
MELDTGMGELMAKLSREAKEGGELKELPCPLCGRPRSQRSEYVRCTPCATNWMDGEDLGKDPRIDRFNQIRRSGAPSAPAIMNTPTVLPAAGQVEGANTLPSYLSRNPAAARPEAARMLRDAQKHSAGSSAADAE